MTVGGIKKNPHTKNQTSEKKFNIKVQNERNFKVQSERPYSFVLYVDFFLMPPQKQGYIHGLPRGGLTVKNNKNLTWQGKKWVDLGEFIVCTPTHRQ